MNIGHLSIEGHGLLPLVDTTVYKNASTVCKHYNRERPHADYSCLICIGVIVTHAGVYTFGGSTSRLVSRARLLCNCRAEEQSGHMSQRFLWHGECNDYAITGFVAHVLQGFVGCLEHACQFASVRRALGLRSTSW